MSAATNIREPAEAQSTRAAADWQRRPRERGRCRARIWLGLGGLLLWPAAGAIVVTVALLRCGMARSWRACLLLVIALGLVGGSLYRTNPNDVTVAARAVVVAPFTIPAVGWGVAHPGAVGIQGGLVVVTGMGGGYGDLAGITIGGVFLTGETDVEAELLAHESRHADQWAVLGGLFPPLYFAAKLRSGGSAHGNFFEAAAGLEDGGYGS